MKYFVVRKSDSSSMFSKTELTFFQDNEEISSPGHYGQGPFSPSDTFDCVLQSGPEGGPAVADILRAAGSQNTSLDQELRRKHGISDIYESDGIVSEKLFEILREAAPDHIFGAKVSLVLASEKVTCPYRFLLLKELIESFGSKEVPGIHFWGMASFKPEQANGKKVFLLSKMGGSRDRGESDFHRLFMKLLCVDETVATKIASADLSCVQLSEFRI